MACNATISRRIRVKTENGERYAALLRDAGHTAKWLGPGTADASLYGGCADPGCCPQHDSAYHPGDWGAIETDASASKAHRIWTASACPVCHGHGGATGADETHGYDPSVPCHYPR